MCCLSQPQGGGAEEGARVSGRRGWNVGGGAGHGLWNWRLCPHLKSGSVQPPSPPSPSFLGHIPVRAAPPTRAQPASSPSARRAALLPASKCPQGSPHHCGHRGPLASGATSPALGLSGALRPGGGQGPGGHLGWRGVTDFLRGEGGPRFRWPVPLPVLSWAEQVGAGAERAWEPRAPAPGPTPGPASGPNPQPSTPRPSPNPHLPVPTQPHTHTPASSWEGSRRVY